MLLLTALLSDDLHESDNLLRRGQFFLQLFGQRRNQAVRGNADLLDSRSAYSTIVLSFDLQRMMRLYVQPISATNGCSLSLRYGIQENVFPLGARAISFYTSLTTSFCPGGTVDISRW